MKKKDFGEMMKKVLKAFEILVGTCFFFAINLFQALPQRDDADKMEKHMFRVYDANDDGYVDFVEFMVRNDTIWDKNAAFFLIIR